MPSQGDDFRALACARIVLGDPAARYAKHCPLFVAACAVTPVLAAATTEQSANTNLFMSTRLPRTPCLSPAILAAGEFEQIESVAVYPEIAEPRIAPVSR
jgi:hypothetical protein